MTVMVFKSPGPNLIHGYAVEYKVLEEDGVQEYTSAGWFLTAIEAGEAAKKAADDAAAVTEQAADDEVAQELKDATDPPTRAELEQMADKCGVKYDGRTSDRKLRALIDAEVAKD